jgi:hypothetical protein
MMNMPFVPLSYTPARTSTRKTVAARHASLLNRESSLIFLLAQEMTDVFCSQTGDRSYLTAVPFDESGKLVGITIKSLTSVTLDPSQMLFRLDRPTTATFHAIFRWPGKQTPCQGASRRSIANAKRPVRAVTPASFWGG